MDSITHLALGAVIGHITARSIPRKKAMLLGALAQSLPDIDFVAGLWLDPASNLLAHRGFTHSIVFAAMVSFILALIMDRWFRRQETPLKFWFFFFALQLSVHLLIDLMNVYGVGLFEPFDHTRFSLNLIFVADPFFSILPVVASMVLLFVDHQRSTLHWALSGIAGPTIYLLLALAIKVHVMSVCRNEFQKPDIAPSRYFITPTPMNVLLWYIVAEKDPGYWIGYRSLFDDGSMKFTFIPKDNELLDPVDPSEDLQLLQRFSQGYYVITKENDALLFSDIRFGQAFGWVDPKADFVFRYSLQEGSTNTLVVQRGRFSNISKENIKATMERIAGD